MGIQAGEKGDTTYRFKLPKVLSYYNKSDYTTQQKARFIFYLCIAAIVGLFFLILSTSYVQIHSAEYDGIYFPVILAEIIVLILFIGCLFLLVKGYYNISSHLFISSAILCVWIVMWVDHGEIVSRLDTIVIILALLNMAPLFITKYKSTILIYILANVTILIVFILILKDQIKLPNSSIVDYIIDTSAAMIFTGIVGYNIFRINKESLEKVEFDNKERKKAEEALKHSEMFRRRVFDSSEIPIVVMESTSFKYIDINPAAVKMYGFPSHEASLGKTPLDVSAPVQYDGTLSSEKAVSYIEKALKEGSVTFEWLHQRPDGEFWDAEVHLLSFKSDEETLLQFSLIDITERKKIESELRESELRYRTLFENAQTGIYQTTPEGKILQSNPAIIKMLGFDSLEELNKRDLKTEKVFVKSTRNNFIEIIEKQGFVKDFEAEWKKKNDETIIIRENARAVRDAEGKTLYYEGFVENITERKQAEKALKESQQLFQALAQVSPVGIFRTNADGYTTYVNPKWMELSGLTFEEAIGDGWLTAVHPEDKEMLRDNWKSHSGKSEKSTAEYRFIKPDGSIVWVLGNAEPEIVDNKIKGYIGTITDITERKLAEKELKESEEKYRTLMESMNEVVIMADNDHRVKYVNKKFTEKLGYAPEEIIGKIGYKILHDTEDYKVIEKANSERLNKKVSYYEVVFIAKDGRRLDFLVNGAPVIDTEGKSIGSIGTMVDITEKKIIEKELEKHRNHLEFLVKDRTEELATSNEELLSTNEELHNQREELETVLKNLQNTQKQLVQAEKMASLGVLASGVAHEINNPLNFIKGGIFGLEQYFDENLKEHKNEVSPLIEGINIGVERAANIVTSLNHYSRRDDSKLIECDIHSIIDNCLVMFRNQIINRIDIKKNYSPKMHSLYGNEGKLHQAMLNILSNAVQAIDNKGIINIKTTVSKQKITILVSDTGCGISAENMPKIFDPFFTTKEAGKGTGLGLSITFNILEEHNGTIEFESSVGHGSTVKITLPLNKI
ncbi:MAG: PAS domain S-box protein [Bacteroidales bacterium]|nr:PAS domain S-box protein [Bacteroidales bacterium]